MTVIFVQLKRTFYARRVIFQLLQDQYPCWKVASLILEIESSVT